MPMAAGTDDRYRVARPHLACQHTDLEAGGQDVAEHHQRFGVYVLRCRIQTVVGMWYTDVLGLGAVDLMAENPAAIRAMCVKLLLAVFTATT